MCLKFDNNLFVCDLKLKFYMPETEANNKFYKQKSMNKLAIIDEFYDTETMTNLKFTQVCIPWLQFCVL
jgi:hypothetical protein